MSDFVEVRVDKDALRVLKKHFEEDSLDIRIFKDDLLIVDEDYRVCEVKTLEDVAADQAIETLRKLLDGCIVGLVVGFRLTSPSVTFVIDVGS